MLLAGSVHGANDYIRWVGRSQEERYEQRKAARLCLDTSAHAGSDFQQLMTVLSHVSKILHKRERSDEVQSKSGNWKRYKVPTLAM